MIVPTLLIATALLIAAALLIEAARAQRISFRL
jgi:hypothetical protein